METTFGIVSIEDNTVYGDGDDFDNDFNQGADKGPVLVGD